MAGVAWLSTADAAAHLGFPSAGAFRKWLDRQPPHRPRRHYLGRQLRFRRVDLDACVRRARGRDAARDRARAQEGVIVDLLDLLRLVASNVRLRWREWRDRRVLAGETLYVEIHQGWSRASSQRRQETALRSAPRESAAPTSSLADDLRSRLVRDLRWRMN